MMTTRIVKKSSTWWKHGKNKGAHQVVAQMNREAAERQHPREPMVGSVRELFARER